MVFALFTVPFVHQGGVERIPAEGQHRCTVGRRLGKLAECEYCHEGLDGYVKPLEKNGYAYLDTRCINAPKLIIGFGRAIRICNIRYCPMCGRRFDNA